MQIRVDKFRNNLQLLKLVVPKKATLDVLYNVRLGNGQIVADDLETAVIIRVPELTEDCLLPYLKTMELLKFVPGDEMLTIEPQDRKVKLSWAEGSAVYPNKYGPDDYPTVPLPQESEVKSEGNVDGDQLVNTLVNILAYVAADNSRPVLSGVTLILGNPIYVAAGDGFRAAHQSMPATYPSEETLILPANSVSVIEQLWKKLPKPVPLAASLVTQLISKRLVYLTVSTAGKLILRFGDAIVVCSLIQGSPPDFKKLIDGMEEPIKLCFFAGELYNAARRIADIANASNGIARLLWTDSEMVVSAHSEDHGDVEAKLRVQPGADPGRIAVNVKYLLEYFARKDGLVTMGISTRSSPIVLRYGSNPVVAIMPMQAQWDDDPKPEKPPEEPEPPENTAEEPEPENLEETEGEPTEEPATEEVEGTEEEPTQVPEPVE
jgi:DNA polymerase III sliding clamp (beta) subunit (PCNA family)